MGFRWNCLESLTGIGIGVASIGAATFLPGAEIGIASAATGAVIGGAGLLARIKENGRKAGLEDENLIARMQARLLRDLDHWDQRAEREAARRADAAMTRLLPQVMLSRQELAATALECRGAEDRYPAVAAQRVVDELARHDDLFRAPPAGLPESLERQFARDAVTAALLAAKEDPQYAALMTLDVAIELGAAIRETIDAVQSLHDKVERGFAALQDRAQSDDAKLARLSEKAIRGAIGRFIAFSPRAETEEIVEAVETFAQDYDTLLGRVRELDAHDNRVRGLQQAAEQALEEGDLDEARRCLREAGEVRVDAAAQAVREAAATLARLAETDLLALDWESAAANWERAAAMLKPFDAKAAGHLMNKGGIALLEFGGKRSSGALGAAAAAFRLHLEVHTREAAPDLWATGQNNLGNALRSLGDRFAGEAGIAFLAEAVAAYRAAIGACAEHGLRTDWAKATVNLGNVLWMQGDRTVGKAGRALLDEAVTAYRSALEMLSRQQTPIEWATVHNNLGNVLRTQGERQAGKAGLALLDEAVSAFRAALEVRTREEMPVDWAMTWNNLGNALLIQGNRLAGAAGIAALDEAADAYRAALEVLTRDQNPIDWARTQANLATALLSKGKRLAEEGGKPFLHQAVAAYREAFEVLTRDQAPVLWSTSQDNLGSALYVLGQIEDEDGGLPFLDDAVAAYRAALEVRTAEQMAIQWAMTQNNLANALSGQALLLGGELRIARLDEAVAAYRAAVTVLTRDEFPVQWAGMHDNIATTFVELADADPPNRCAHYRTAREAILLALEVYTPEHMPHDHGSASETLAQIGAAIAEHCPPGP
jgi:tetratricopeptide (TPR) repeat protein